MKHFFVIIFIFFFKTLIAGENDVNPNALFLGEKTENESYFKKMLDFVVEKHFEWRKNFHPSDSPAISLDEQQRKDFESTIRRTEEALAELMVKLHKSTMPLFSPRYIAHMVSDTMIVANLGYFATSLCNPNNCAYEASPATTELEIEVGTQLANLFGYDTKKSWGHLTSGGTVSNIEALWVARNIKSIPFTLKKIVPSLVSGYNDWQLSNMKIGQLLDLVEQAKEMGYIDKIREFSTRGQGVDSDNIGKILIPRSRHYSFAKAADILGIGQKNIIDIPVNNAYQMDIDYLKKVIKDLVQKKIPIIAVVAVMGTTEEGSIDSLHEIVQIRDEYEQEGISFYVHVDAAYGGYIRSLFINEQNQFMSLEEFNKKGIVDQKYHWPSRSIYESFKVMNEADSITVDPHKLGYIPYPAGAIVMKDKRVLDLISYFAAYVTEENGTDPVLLGSYILEGSKSGAAAAAVWVAHRVVPLNITGYGKLIGNAINNAYKFYDNLVSFKEVNVGNKKFNVKVLTKPDSNIIDFVFFDKNQKNLKAMNELNKKIYQNFSHKTANVCSREFLLSKTTLNYDSYGDTPQKFVEEIGISPEEWNKEQSVYILRACIMSPYLSSNDGYCELFNDEIKKLLE